MTNILVIDDDVHYCRTLKKVLELRGGYSVRATTHGKEGIELARRHRPDMILLDIMMPGMNGTEVAAELLKNATTMSIPIMFVTGLIKHHEAERREGIVGNQHMMAKPVIIDDLILRIESVRMSN